MTVLIKNVTASLLNLEGLEADELSVEQLHVMSFQR